MEQFSLRAVRALFLERQHLRRPRAIRLTAANLERFAQDAGGLQLDSINVVDRAHYLTLWSRFGEYDRALADRLAYRRGILFEYWAHAACLVPRSHLPMWRQVMCDYTTRHTGWGKWLGKHSSAAEAVLGRIALEGPLSNKNFKVVRKRPGAGWWDWKPAAHALHVLWMSGKLSVRSRTHFQKFFDLTPRVLPEAEGLEPPGSDAFVRWHMGQSLRGMGAATIKDLRGYLTFPRMNLAQRSRIFRELLESGEIVEIAVDGEVPSGLRPARWIARAKDVAPLRAAGRRRKISEGATLLAPFDSLMWHRERVKRLFEFDYRIEVYTPGEKRTHGYYTMPLLVDGAIVGRVDAKNNRQEGRLEIRNAHFEPGSGLSEPERLERSLAGAAEALVSLQRFLGARSWKLYKTTPARLAPLLSRQLKRLG